MLDFSEVQVFAAKLQTTPSVTVEESWRGEWSQKVADEMRLLAPSDTGALRASIRTTRDGVGVGVPYAGYVEYGTSRTGPQPFAQPAVNRLIRPAAEDAGRQVLRDLT